MDNQHSLCIYVLYNNYINLHRSLISTSRKLLEIHTFIMSLFYKYEAMANIEMILNQIGQTIDKRHGLISSINLRGLYDYRIFYIIMPECLCVSLDRNTVALSIIHYICDRRVAGRTVYPT